MCMFSNDCHDNSDEKASLCQAEQCSPGQFQCRNKQCIPYDAVCDGIRNCTDGSDESVSCGKIIEEVFTSMNEHVFKCECLSIGVNECASTVLSGCEHGCVNTLTSFRCTCRAGYKLASNQRNCRGMYLFKIEMYTRLFVYARNNSKMIFISESNTHVYI
jgi:hypothetical protein